MPNAPDLDNIGIEINRNGCLVQRCFDLSTNKIYRWYCGCGCGANARKKGRVLCKNSNAFPAAKLCQADKTGVTA